jgi:hypothetical protein
MISREVVEISDRLGSSAENWRARLQKLSGGSLLCRLSPLIRRTFGLGESS